MTSRQTNRRSLRLAIILLSGSALAGVPLAALADSAWLGGTSNDWFDATNWSPAAVPTAVDNVLVDLNANVPVIASGATANAVTVGQSNTANLTVSGATLTSSRDISLDVNTGSSGSLLLQGGSTLNMTGVGTQLNIGIGGAGSLIVATGSTANPGTNMNIGTNGGNGQVQVTGAGSSIDALNITLGLRNSTGGLSLDTGGTLGATSLIVGLGGTATMDATDTGTSVTAAGLYIGSAGTGTVTFENAASLSNATDLIVGGAAPSQPVTGGTATLNILTGASVLSSGTAEIGLGVGYTGTATVDGMGSNWQVLNGLSVGKDGGNGTLIISNQGSVTSANLTVGVTTGSTGVVTAQDSGTHLQTLDMVIGGGGNGTLNVNAQAVVSTNSTTYVGEILGGVGTVNVDGPGSEFDPNDLFIGGNDLDTTSGGTGTLNITNNASVLPATVSLGLGTHSSGMVTADGHDSGLLATGNMIIGAYGVGILNITNGGFASAPDISLGVQAGSSGTINMSDANSGFGTAGTLHIGVAGNGTVTVANLASLDANDMTLGEAASSTGAITVDNAGVSVAGTVSVGVNGTGSVTVLPTGGAFNAGAIDLGVNTGSHGTMSLSHNPGVPDPSSSAVGALTVGDAGTGTLALSAGGEVFVQQSVEVGAQSGSNGTVTVADALSLLTSTSAGAGLVVGRDSGAVGSVTFSNGGTGGFDKTELGVSSGATGTITVTDVGSSYEAFDDVYIGEGGTGTVNVKNGGKFEAAALTIIGDNPGATGTLNIDGAGSTFTADDVMLVGGDAVNAAGGNGTVRVTNGGTLAGSGIYLAVLPGSTGTMLVDGVGSTVSGALVSVGYGATGNATVQNGGAITANIVDIAGIPNSTGTLTIDGAGSSVNAHVTGAVGDFGNGTLIVRNGGAYSAGQAIIGYENAGGFVGNGTATVDGAGSTFTAQSLDVGLAGHGALIVANGGVATVTGALRIATLAGSVGEIDIGAAPGSAPAAPGSIAASSITFGAGTGSVNFNSTGVTFNTVISGAGTINQIAGDTVLPGDESAFTGATNITGGALHVNGSLRSSAVTVSSGGTLNGNGTVGSVSAASGGIVAPGNSIGALTVNGDYNAASGSIYQAQLDSTGHADLLTVTGTATLANGAILNVTKTDAGGYAPGTYTLLTAAGGINGTYTVAGDIIQSSAFTSQKVSYDSHDVYLNVSKVASFASAGITPNQIAVGGGADSLPTTSPLYGALISLPTFAVAQGTFDQLSGEIHASAKTAELEDSRLPREAALGRLSMAFAAGDAGSKHPAPWGQVYGSWGSSDANGNAAALGRSSRGFLGGFDLPVYEMWRVGILGGYSRGSFNVKDRSSFGTSDSYHLGGYAGLQDGALGVRFGMVYSWHDLTTGRTVNFAGFNNVLASEYNAGTTQGFGEVGYHVPVAKIDLEPFANLAYVSLHTDGFSETGGTAALNAAGDTENTVFTTLGLRGKYDITLGNALIGTHGTVGWRHAFGDLTPNTAMSFVGSSAFTIQGVPLAQDAAAFGTGFDLSVARNVLLGVSYNGQYAASAHDDTIKLNIDWKL